MFVDHGSSNTMFTLKVSGDMGKILECALHLSVELHLRASVCCVMLPTGASDKKKLKRILSGDCPDMDNKTQVFHFVDSYSLKKNYSVI